MILYILSILLQAAGDGLNNRGIKTWGHLFVALSVLCLLLYPFVGVVSAWAIAAYVLYRVAVFDVTYNLARGLRWDYVGSSNWWDKLWRKCPSGMMLLFRVLALIVAISITFQQL